MLKIVAAEPVHSFRIGRIDWHETTSPAPPIEGTLADPAPGDFRERLHDGCIHASLKARPLPIFGLDDGLALAAAARVFGNSP
jgi:hypothetical protein